MTALREAAQQALAFIRWSQFGECRTEGWDKPPPKAHEAEAALRAALAEPVQEPFTRKEGEHMTDRERLELAAKAAGVDTTRCLQYEDGAFDWPGKAGRWNPLTDDGDALRLAVKLNLHISVFVDAIGVGTPGAGYDELKYEGCPYAATRRAIVRAAAEIERGMA